MRVGDNTPSFRSAYGDLQLEVGIECNGFAYWMVISEKEDDLASGNVIDPEFDDGPEAPLGWKERVLRIANERCRRVAIALSDPARLPSDDEPRIVGGLYDGARKRRTLGGKR